MRNIQPKEIYLLIIFALIMMLSALDLFLDLDDGINIIHAIHEGGIIVLAFIALSWLLLDIRQQAIEIEALQKELSTIQKPENVPEKYILDARLNLGNVIQQQFNDWQLTNSEQEVGRLLLKGLSLKEIAVIRSTLEKTVRQQASSIYKKAGLAGRHAFSAWFIEDIL